MHFERQTLQSFGMDKLSWLTNCSFIFDVIYKYNSEDTSFKQLEEPISEVPTLTLCFSDYHDIGNELGNFSMFYNDYFSNELYHMLATISSKNTMKILRMK